jgi:hypothetical protein
VENKITCPKCAHHFNVEEALASHIEEKLKQDFDKIQKQKEAELAEKENKLRAYQAKLIKEREDQEAQLKKTLILEKQKLEEQLKGKVKEDFEMQLKTMQEEIEERKKENRELKTKELDLLKKEKELKEKRDELEMELEKKLLTKTKELEDQLKGKVKEDFELQLKSLQDEVEERKKENRELKTKELDLLKKEKDLNDKKEELELEMEKRFLNKAKDLEEDIRKRIDENNQLKIKEKDMQLDSLRKQIDEMKRKAEQGSMQLQGEAQEVVLEGMLREVFPFDLVEEVGKGVRGADVIHTVRNSSGKDCGKIIYESKRTKAFSDGWIEKLKGDLRGQKADLAVLVTETMPKDMEKFGMRDGVWVCSFNEVKGVAMILRDTLIKLTEVKLSQENKGDKMQMLYDYLTGNEFRQQMEAIVEGFSSMQEALAKEKLVTQKLWKEREKQLEKVLHNTVDMYGSIKGIAGKAVGDIKYLETPDLLEEGD